MKRIVLILLVLALGCSVFGRKAVKVEVTHNEIEQFLVQNPDLPDFDKSCLMNREFSIGMQGETLRFMLGEPREIKIVKEPWATQEIWYYRAGGKKYFTIEDGGIVGIQEDN